MLLLLSTIRQVCKNAVLAFGEYRSLSDLIPNVCSAPNLGDVVHMPIATFPDNNCVYRWPTDLLLTERGTYFGVNQGSLLGSKANGKLACPDPSHNLT